MGEFTVAFKVNGKSPDVPRDMYHLAQAFYLAGNRASLIVEVGPNLTQSLLSPSVVNYCFSIELFFKALILNVNGRKTKGHKLKVLFDELPEEIRLKIRNTYPEFIQIPDIDSFLEAVSEYFVQVRYEYEYPIEFYYESVISAFAKIVYVICSDIFGQAVNIPNVTV